MSSIYDNIPLKNKAKLLKMVMGYNVKYNKNQEITDHLNDEDDIALVVSGKIQIVRNNYNGTTTILEEFNKDDLINSISIYLKNNDTEVIAKEETEITLFSYKMIISQDIKDYTYNQFIKNLFIIFNNQISSRNERIEILSKRTIRDKLLEYFSIMSRKSGSKYVYLPFNFSSLANYLAIDRSAMSRELSYMKEERLITVKGKRITLLYR